MYIFLNFIENVKQIFLKVLYLFWRAHIFQNYGLYLHIKCWVFLYTLFSSFSVCISIDDEPSGLVLKFRQNSMDGFSVVLSMFHSQIVIRNFQVTMYPRRTTIRKLTLLVASTPCWEWEVEHNYRLTSLWFSSLCWYSHCAWFPLSLILLPY